ncbi:DUF222 domain-containing protein [Angustibacter sp. McL0619]|uniref:HNH endonuclease signature motif containing protein n=1 Tax=Angustibacter sp. McL0619 TaxID=3415676 RepID=UPI003CEED025
MFETAQRERRLPVLPADADPALRARVDPVSVAEDEAWLWALSHGFVEPLAATDAVAEAVSGLRGDELAAFLPTLPAPPGVDGWTVIEAVKGYEKVMRWAAAQQLRWIAELARRRPDGRSRWSRGDAVDPLDPAEGTPGERLMGRVGHDGAVEIAFALGESTRVAKDLIYQALCLTERLPATLAALSAGEVSRRVAAVVADETSVLEADVVAGLDESLAERVAGRTAPEARAKVRRAVVAADPGAARAREQKARRQRGFEVERQVVDGMGTFGGYAPIADVMAIDARVRELADRARAPGDDRTAAARRLDVVTDLLLGRSSCAEVAAEPEWLTQPVQPNQAPQLREASQPSQPAQPAQTAQAAQPAQPAKPAASRRSAKPWAVDVVVSLATLLGGDDAGELQGFGPITAETARELAGDGVWRRLLTDPVTGIVTDCGTQRYRPPPGLADLVRARDRACHAPGCRQPAARCDLDHVLDSPAGPSPVPHPRGATADWNLGPLCRTHHTCKPLPGWRVTSPSPGTFQWKTPSGHTYTTEPGPPLEPPF